MSRVVLVARRYPPDVRSGRARSFARLVERMAAEHETRLVAGYTRSRELVPPDALGVDLRGRPAVLAHLELARAVRVAAAELHAEVAVVSGLDLPRPPVPSVAVVRDLVGTGWGRAPVRGWYRWRARRFDRVVVPSQRVRASVQGLGVDPWRVVVIPDGFEIEAPTPWPSSERLEVVHAGRILPSKEQHLSVDAVARLAPALRQRVRLTVAGPVGDPVYLEQLRLAAEGHPVRFLEVDDVREALAQAQLVLYPTALDEGLPDVAVQAMCQGRPVVYTDRPSVREALGEGGLAVPPDDVGALQAVLREALAAPGELEALGRRAREVAGERFGWSRVWPRWRTLLEGLLR